MNNSFEKTVIFTDDSQNVKPSEGTKCIIKLTNITYECATEPNFSLKYGEATLFHSNEPLTLIIGEVDYDPDKLLESVIKTMYCKEISDIKLKLKIFRGANFYDVSINLRLELLSIIHIGYIHEWSHLDRLYIARRHKDRGVDFFTKKKIVLAFRRFSKALKLLITVEDISETVFDQEEYKLYQNLRRDLYNNIALCRQNMKVENANENLQYIVYLCNKTLEIDANNIKALMRLVKARTQLKDYDLALDAAKHILLLEPNNTVAKNDVVRLTHILNQQKQESDLIVKKMFSNMI